MTGRKGTAHRYVRHADRDRCEQAAAAGHTAEFASTILGLPVSVVERVWSDMDAIHREEPTRPAARTAYGRGHHGEAVPSAGRAKVGRPSNAERAGEAAAKLASPEIGAVVDQLTRDRWSAAQIARHLGVAERTVTRHRATARAVS